MCGAGHRPYGLDLHRHAVDLTDVEQIHVRGETALRAQTLELPPFVYGTRYGQDPEWSYDNFISISATDSPCRGLGGLVLNALVRPPKHTVGPADRA